MKRITLLSLLLLINCKEAKKPVMETEANTQAVNMEKSHPGKRILETECYVCHDPKASQEGRIAPPMASIKEHYIDERTSKAQFTKDLIAWVNNPETESKMPGAHQRFGSMPYIPYPDDAIVQIAEYLYDYEIEKPDWFDTQAADWSTPSKKHQNEYSDMGMEYALTAKEALGKNLMKAIQKNGPAGAVEFCNLNVLQLIDSVSVMKNAVIKRVSDKPRNTANRANGEELGYITYFKKIVAAGKAPKPIVKTEKGEVDFYYPITTNAMCLQCHGKSDGQIQPATLTILKNLYPEDKAMGYDIDEVRGIWAINFATTP